MSAVRVHFLGTGGPSAPGGRMQTCIMLDGPGGRYLIDCGATAVVSLARAGIDPASIDGVLLTHLHGDHFGGLPFLILEAADDAGRPADRPWRARPLRIAGPPETEERVRQTMQVFGYGGIMQAVRQAGTVEFVTLPPGQPVRLDELDITVFLVRHTPEATALRVVYGGRTIAYSGDTAWTESLVEAADGADLFICVAYTFDIPQRTILTYQELLAHRAELRCKRLILTHLGAQMQQRLAEVAEEVAEDGLVIELG